MTSSSSSSLWRRLVVGFAAITVVDALAFPFANAHAHHGVSTVSEPTATLGSINGAHLRRHALRDLKKRTTAVAEPSASTGPMGGSGSADAQVESGYTSDAGTLLYLTASGASGSASGQATGAASSNPAGTSISLQNKQKVDPSSGGDNTYQSNTMSTTALADEAGSSTTAAASGPSDKPFSLQNKQQVDQNSGDADAYGSSTTSSTPPVIASDSGYGSATTQPVVVSQTGYGNSAQPSGSNTAQADQAGSSTTALAGSGGACGLAPANSATDSYSQVSTYSVPSAASAAPASAATGNCTASTEGVITPSGDDAVPLDFTISSPYDSNTQYYVYITGTSGGKSVFVDPSGQGFIAPTGGADGVPLDVTCCIAFDIPAGSGATITIPGFLKSARVYVSKDPLWFGAVKGADGSDSIVQPAFNVPGTQNYDATWGFVELDWSKNTNPDVPGKGVLWINLSYVDFVGLPLGLQVDEEMRPGMIQGGMDKVCDNLKALGGPWAGLCMMDENNSTVKRVLAPHMVATPDNEMGQYYEPYISKVWTALATTPVIMNAQQAAIGVASCQVQGDQMVCSAAPESASGVASSYTGTPLVGRPDQTPAPAAPSGGVGEACFPKPNTIDILGCNSGPFANIDEHKAPANALYGALLPRICAAWVRSTWLCQCTQPGQESEVGNWYTCDKDGITDHYAHEVHKQLVFSKGYAFSYDDVGPGANDVDPMQASDGAGTIAKVDPGHMNIWIGGMPEGGETLRLPSGL